MSDCAELRFTLCSSGFKAESFFGFFLPLSFLSTAIETFPLNFRERKRSQLEMESNIAVLP